MEFRSLLGPSGIFWATHLRLISPLHTLQFCSEPLVRQLEVSVLEVQSPLCCDHATLRML